MQNNKEGNKNHKFTRQAPEVSHKIKKATDPL
nr:MAG TPA: hypothetical protein [Caudoviricetes sp.]